MAWLTARTAMLRSRAMLVERRFDFTYDGMPLSATRLSRAQRRNLVLAGVDLLRSSERVLASPPAVRIEPSGRCNLRCPLCPTGDGLKRRPSGLMPLSLFRDVIDEIGDTLISVILYGWGEPLLNPELPEMIALCSERNIQTLCSTNGTLLNASRAEALVDAGLSALVVALDGTTQEIYGRYRVGGDVEAVMASIEHVETAKARRRVGYPYTNLRTVVSSHNQHQLPAIEQHARCAAANMFSTKSLGCLIDHERFEEFEPDQEELRRFADRDEVLRRQQPVHCPYPFRQPTIYWDGTVVGCEFDFDATKAWGRVGDQPFGEIWNGPIARQQRRSLRRWSDLPPFCETCPYRQRKGGASELKTLELRPRVDARP